MQPVLYHDPTTSFPESNEKPGYFVGFDLNAGDVLTFKVITADMKTVLTRSVVRPADDCKHRNRRVHFKDEAEDKIIKNDNQHEDFKHSKPLKPADEAEEAIEDNEDTDSEDEGIATRTRSKSKVVGALHTQTVQEMAKKKEHNHLLNWLVIPTAILFLLFQISYWAPNTTGVNIPDITETAHFQKTIENADRHHMAHLKYVNACDKWLEDVENSWDNADFINKDLWDAKRVLGHRMKHNKVEVKVEWNDINKGRSWVDAYSLALQDPTEILKYAKTKQREIG